MLSYHVPQIYNIHDFENIRKTLEKCYTIQTFSSNIIVISNFFKSHHTHVWKLLRQTSVDRRYVWLITDLLEFLKWVTLFPNLLYSSKISPKVHLYMGIKIRLELGIWQISEFQIQIQIFDKNPCLRIFAFCVCCAEHAHRPFLMVNVSSFSQTEWMVVKPPITF